MKDTPNILPRDKLLRDNFTAAESFLFGVLLFLALLVFCLGDPRSFWLLGSLLILGCLTPFILKTHERTHPFFVDRLWPKFWICTSPAWIFIIQFIIGLIQNPLKTVDVGKLTYHTVGPISLWRPTSAVDTNSWLIIFGFGAAYVLATTLYIVPKSRSFFERFLPWLCMGAVLLGAFGLIQKGLGLTGPIFSNGTGSEDFFAFFPYDGHWAAFAALWCCTCIAMALLSMRYDDGPSFIHSSGPWYLTGGTLLGASALLIHAALPAAFLLLTLSIMLFIVVVEFLNNSKDIHRITIAICSGLGACLAVACAIIRIFQEQAFSTENALLRRAAWDMFQDNPIFGWGIDSYAKLLPFYSSDTLLGQRRERAASDVLQFMAEFGLLGCLVAFGVFSTFVLLCIRKKSGIRLTNHLSIGCGAVLTLACVDTPFMSPSVFVSFFVIFFCALRWGELSRNKVDEVDAARPQLVTTESERRVPFFDKPYKEKEK